MVGAAAAYDLRVDPEAPRQLGDLEESEPERRPAGRTAPVKKALDQFLAEFEERLREHPGEAATSATAALEGRAEGTWRTPIEGGERLGRRLPRRVPWRRAETEPRPTLPVAPAVEPAATAPEPVPPAVAPEPPVATATPVEVVVDPLPAPRAVAEEPQTMEAAEASGLLDSLPEAPPAPPDTAPGSRRWARPRRRHRHR